MQAHTIMSETYHISLYFLYDYHKHVNWICIHCSTHDPHVRVWIPSVDSHTSKPPFIVRRAFSWSYCFRTPVRNSDRQSIIMNIMIVFLPRSVRVHTIIKEGYFPDAWTHNDAWGPNIFNHCHVRQHLSFSFISCYFHPSFPCINWGCAPYRHILSYIIPIMHRVASCHIIHISYHQHIM